jgi:hypothetical protein
MTIRSLTQSVFAGSIVALAAGVSAKAPITEACVHEAQKNWAEAVVHIGKVHTDGGDTRAAATEVAGRLYGFHLGEVFFKPTVASNPQFRLTGEDALSYFVGGHIAEDAGFALTPWTNVRFENVLVRTYGEIALAMGNYYFTNTKGEVTKVEYTKGYVRDSDGGLRIVLQHSSLPYQPPAASAAATTTTSTTETAASSSASTTTTTN